MIRPYKSGPGAKIAISRAVRRLAVCFSAICAASSAWAANPTNSRTARSAPTVQAPQPDVDSNNIPGAGAFTVTPRIWSSEVGLGVFEVTDVPRRAFNIAVCKLQFQEVPGAGGERQGFLRLTDCQMDPETWVANAGYESFKTAWQSEVGELYEQEVHTLVAREPVLLAARYPILERLAPEVMGQARATFNDLVRARLMNAGLQNLLDYPDLTRAIATSSSLRGLSLSAVQAGPSRVTMAEGLQASTLAIVASAAMSAIRAQATANPASGSLARR